MTDVLICDDQAYVREGLRRAVTGVPGVDRVETAASGEEALKRFAARPADLVLMDVQMPGMGGIEATRRLVLLYPDATVVMLTVAADRDAVGLAVAGGARGYLAKDVTADQVRASVASALAIGDLDGLAAAPRPRPTASAEHSNPPVLTEREMQVLRGMSQGKSNGAIGRELYLSEDTIKTHARRLFRKLAVSDRAQAVALGFRYGLVR